MSTALVPKSTIARLRLPALAAALAVAASASYAGAVVKITSFSVTASGPTDESPEAIQTYAVATGQDSFLEMMARNKGGSSTDSPPPYSDPSWNDSPNVTAQTSAAFATGNIISFTDPLTQLQTGGFNLSASAKLYSFATAMATGAQGGAFSLIDAAGDPTAGTLWFDVFYDLIVSPGNASNEAFVTFSAADEDGAFIDSRMRTSLGTTSGQFERIRFDLDANEFARFALVGTAFASAIPEPGTMALAMMGLFAAGASCRSRTRRQA